MMDLKVQMYLKVAMNLKVTRMKFNVQASEQLFDVCSSLKCL